MEYACSRDIKIFTCNSNRELAEQIAQNLNMQLGLSEVSRFSDGETSLRIDEPVRGKDVFIIQSTCPPVNDHLMELLIMIDALYRASAGRITAVVPYYGYARQDRKSRARDPISAKLVANLLVTAGAHRLMTIDMHCDQLQGFFDIPTDHLRGRKFFVSYYQEKFDDLSDVVVVSPDLGSVTRARIFAERLDVPMAIVDKRRPKANVSEVMNIIGEIKGKKVILIDDMIDTAGSIVNAAKALYERGATEIYACCTHALLSGNAVERIDQSEISELVALNTIMQPPSKRSAKIKILSVADLFAQAIHRIHESKPISELFD